jgi:ribose 5-phosphate isomerase B
MKIIIASDHAGVSTRSAIVKHLEGKNINVMDLGPFTENSVDYPEYAHAACLEVIMSEEKDTYGILLCGSGNGINMTANKHEEIRSALCWTPEIATLAKQHNDANVLAMPARFISEEEAIKIVDAYLEADFEGGRHQRRVDMIPVQDIEIDE